MRPPTLIFSMLVHGGAIGALAVVGVYAHQEVRETPRVEIRSSLASQPSADQVPSVPEFAPSVVAERSTPSVELWRDPIVPERELHRDVLEAADDSVWPEFRVSVAHIARIVVPEPAPATPSASSATVLPQPERVEPPPVVPAPASVHIAARPRADNTAPHYPEHERALGREGTVVVLATVDAYGVVLDVALATSSRYAGFNRAALAAVRKWRFTPETRDGVAVASDVPVTIEFRLADIK